MLEISYEGETHNALIRKSGCSLADCQGDDRTQQSPFIHGHQRSIVAEANGIHEHSSGSNGGASVGAVALPCVGAAIGVATSDFANLEMRLPLA